MAESELGDALRGYSVIDCASPHFGAERTGVFLFAYIKDDFLDVGFQAGIWHIKLIAEDFNRRKIHSLKTQFYGYGMKRKRNRVIGLEMGKGGKKKHAVFPA